MNGYAALIECSSCERRTDVAVIEREGVLALYPHRCVFCYVEWGADVLPARDPMDDYREAKETRYAEMNEEMLREQERR